MLKLLALLALATGPQDPVKVETSYTVPPTEEQGAAVEVLNGFRSIHGLDAVQLDQRLVASAEVHCRAMSKTRVLTHKEDDRATSDASVRARSFGYTGPVSELVASGMPNVPYSVSTFMDAPYHRRLLLRPGRLLFGCAESDGFICLVLGGETAAAMVMSPPDGAQGVPTYWDGIEAPNPVRAPRAKPPFGYPVALYGLARNSFKDVVATLSDDTRAPVACHVDEPSNDPNSPDCVILVPKEPLKPSTVYTATVKAVNDGQEFSSTWSFTTGKDAPPVLTAKAKKRQGR